MPAERLSGFAIEPTRDSKFREILKIPLERGVPYLHEHFPNITANHITLAGAAGVAIASEISRVYNRQPNRNLAMDIGLTSITTLFYAFDGADGAMARYLNQLYPEKANPELGQLVDVGADRFEETYTALARAKMAHEKKDDWGEFFAYSAAVTSTWPSIARAIAEKNGIKVQEDGRNILGLLGSRGGRAGFSIIATVFPEIKNIPVARYADALSTFANLYQTFDRSHQAFFETDQEKIPADKQKQAFARMMFLSAVSGLTIGATYLTYQKQHPKPKEIVIAEF